MFKHQEDHPTLDVPGCFACRITGVGFAPSATPSRRVGTFIANRNDDDKALSKDLAAYKRLRKDGVQPPKIDGSATLEQRADTRTYVETGGLIS